MCFGVSVVGTIEGSGKRTLNKNKYDRYCKGSEKVNSKFDFIKKVRGSFPKETTLGQSSETWVGVN